MESSNSYYEDGTVETDEDSVVEKVNFDIRTDASSKDCVSGDNEILNSMQAMEELNVGHLNPEDSSTVADDSMHLEPEVGMVFYSEEQAYDVYNKYAKKKGFSVRKGHLGRRKDGTIRDRVYLCSYEGTRQKHSTHNTRKPRPVFRTNCMARIEYKVNRDGIWVVNKVIKEHNHPLIRESKAHLLRSHRRLLLAAQDGQQVNQTENSSAKSAEVVSGGGQDFESESPVGFLLRVQSSHLHTDRMRELDKGEMQMLLDFLRRKQLEDPSFFYGTQLDDKEQVTNIFWADARSMLDYSYFGDVVLFDTTYRINKNDLPIAQFIGVNHHKQLVVFGSALLLDETTESFVWLFRTFTSAMSGCQPKTILTDQCPAIGRAVIMTLPNSSHRFCLWHILQNAAKNLSHLYSSDSNFQKDFKSYIYESSSEDDFHSGWILLLDKYDFAGNSYLDDLFGARERWASVYNGNTFCASMMTLEWSDIMKKHFRKHFNRKLPLSKFIEQYSKSLFQYHEKELQEDFRSKQSRPVLLVDMPMLNEAAESYTRLLYRDFEAEFKGQLSCLCELIRTDEITYIFRVSLPEKRCYGIVEFSPSNYTVICSCKKFESTGILCMHALKVLNNNNILHLPRHYIMKRWTKYANDGIANEKFQSIIDANAAESLMLQYSRVCHKAIMICLKNSCSKVGLGKFEHDVDKLMIEVENSLHNSSLIRQTEEMDNFEGMQLDASETRKKRRGRKSQSKDILDKKLKGKDQPCCTSGQVDILAHPSQRQTNNASLRPMVEDSAHISPFYRETTAAYCNIISAQPSSISGCASFPPDTILPPQESFTSSQVIVDHTLVSQGTNSPNLAWCSSRGRASISVPVPLMQGQNSSYLSWVVPTHNISNVGLPPRHLEPLMHATVPNQHASLSRKLNFDINKDDVNFR
ncbi:protein FAR1-RELATED SEQUENCE 5-like isoform X2 [Phalaenopsis equestris]|uniref:protein FAR1-RELATED SEQUENCE 5-like isoform X2 n=1 Tax=Phalaenopsis equestris TaxID=78828 RepID=UPI0009E28C38|nr:protein FAR1-RELATED SEQUENCE 5-like isoform X2 [Phalaenopsis equestris]